MGVAGFLSAITWLRSAGVRVTSPADRWRYVSVRWSDGQAPSWFHFLLRLVFHFSPEND
jgi:hypothetical protein